MAAQACAHATGSCFLMPFIDTKKSNDGEGGRAIKLKCGHLKEARENLLSPSRLEIKETQLSPPAVLDG